MRPALALLMACLLVSGCADDSSEAGPESPPPTSAEPTAADPDAPVDNLYVECLGGGGPTIVLVAGLGTSGDTFVHLRSELAGTARTCVYDRAGLGGSAPLDAAAPDPSPGSAAADLRATLAAEDIDPPYVMLGWSYGGLVAQAYAANYSDELVGLVLEDASVREQFTDPELIDPSGVWEEGGRSVDHGALVEQLAGLDLGELPVAVLSEDSTEGWVPAWHRAHDRLARASTDGVHAVGIGSGHAMHEDVPQLVTRTVVAVWSAASAGDELPACGVVFRGEKVRCRV